MNQTFTSTIISASAGTGKTYTLATRFIALLALGEAPESMIALTFARKAAHEFRERILKDLAAGAADEKGAAALAERIRKAWHGDGSNPPLSPGVDESEHPLNKEAFTSMLQWVVATMGRTRLSTLDSFFSSLLSAGCGELGIGQFSLIGDGERAGVVRAVTDRLLFDIAQDPKESAEFQDVVAALTEGGGRDKSSPHAVFSSLIENYLDEFINTGCNMDMWGNVSAFGLPEPREPKRYTHAERDEVKESLRQVYADAPHKDLSAGIQKLMGGSPPNKAEYTCMVKSAGMLTDATPAERALKGTLLRMVEEARQLILWQCMNRSRSIARFLMKYLLYYTVDVTNNGRFEYSDITRKIPALVASDAARQRLDYRLDNRYHHWMLDEFQDTSDIQWNALKPLIENQVAETAAAPDKSSDRSLFVVGDIKQSIYQWRGGRPAIFASLLSDAPWSESLQRVDMNLSWRSTPCIMDFVNQTFRDFPQVKEHRSAPPLLDRKGYVGLYTCYNGSSSPYPQACRIICGILETLPVKQKQMSVGIIVRTNKIATQIYDNLKSHFGDALPIYLDGQPESVVRNPLGEVLLAFFRWLEHPADTYREAEFKTSPLGCCLKEGEQYWTHWLDVLENSGYAAVLEDFKARLEDNGFALSAHHREVLGLCIREAYAFDACGGALSDWISRLENLSCTCMPPKHAVHIITIHKSKGLEYDAVILPFIQTTGHSAFFSTANVSRLYPNGGGGILIPTGKSAGALVTMWPQLQGPMDNAEQAANEAGLNELYVALTRAAYANYIILHGAQNPNNCSYSGIIKQSITGPDGQKLMSKDKEDILCKLEYGDREWYESAGFDDRDAADAETDREPVLLPGAAPRRRRESPSKSESAPAIPPRRRQAAAQDGAPDPAEFGTRVHALFEQMGRCGSAELPGWVANPADAAGKLVAAALRQPDIQALLSPPANSMVLVEQPVESVTKGAWTSAFIDRLTLVKDGNKVVSAQIVDFKTDKRREASREEQDTALRERHFAQMKAYHNLVCNAFGLPPDKVTVTLVSCPSDGEPRAVPYGAGVKW